MLPRQVKALYYAATALPMRASGALYRTFAAPTDGLVRVHLGPGRHNHLDGWINVDANLFSAKKRPEVWADLRNKLPFKNGTVDAVYSHHVIEHLPDRSLPRHIADIFRCLKPGGVVRIGGPNGDEAARQLLAGNAEWFHPFPDVRSSVGGRYANFILCGGEHTAILTESYMRELFTDAGFTDIHRAQPKCDGMAPELFDSPLLQQEYEETPEAPHTLLLEARKPY